jgi:hypothetical protein
MQTHQDPRHDTGNQRHSRSSTPIGFEWAWIRKPGNVEILVVDGLVISNQGQHAIEDSGDSVTCGGYLLIEIVLRKLKRENPSGDIIYCIKNKNSPDVADTLEVIRSQTQLQNAEMNALRQMMAQIAELTRSQVESLRAIEN